jgi:DNA topoisomerase-2
MASKPAKKAAGGPLADITASALAAAAAPAAPKAAAGGAGAAAGGAGAGAPVSAASIAASSKTLEQIYQKKTQLEHILLRPDSYVGSIQKHTGAMWVWDAGRRRIVSQTITYVPGLYKIFDEILVNAADNKQRDKSMNLLKVVVDPATNTLSVWNNGACRARQ